MKCTNSYQLPVDKRVIETYHSDKSPAHSGKLKNSVDFIVPIGTPIRAARDGLVVWTKDDSEIGGPDKRYWYEGNRIVIKHDNGEYTGYEHLKYRGVVVRKGDTVKTGQCIGYSGNTGYSFRPHLHFEVFHKPDTDESEGITLEVHFDELI